MKKLTIILICFLGTIGLLAQSPNAFKYQAVVRDAYGTSICNTDVSLKFIIHQGSPTGAEVYDETHTPTTNDFGLVNLEIGNGTPVSGNFSAIEWESDIYFITVALDVTGGTNYQDIGTEQLFSVPYAMHSTTAEDAVDAEKLNGQNPTYYLNWNNLNNIPPDIADGDDVDDADNDPANEFQTLSIDGNDLTITPNGNTVPIDGDPTNECQQLSISGDILSLSGGSCSNSSVTLPGLTLPYGPTYNGTSTAFLINHNGSSGAAAEFTIENANNNFEALFVRTYGMGEAGKFFINNSNNSMPALKAKSTGIGEAGLFQQTNSNSNASALTQLAFSVF